MKPEISQMIEEISTMTALNQHTDATIAGCKLLEKVAGQKMKLTPIFESIAVIHRAEGHMPMHLGHYQHEKYTEMMKHAETILGELYEEFHAAF